MITFWSLTLSKMALCTAENSNDTCYVSLPLTHAIIIWALNFAQCVTTVSVFHVSLPSLATKPHANKRATLTQSEHMP